MHCTAGDNFEPLPNPVTLCSWNINNSQLKTYKFCFCYYAPPWVIDICYLRDFPLVLYDDYVNYSSGERFEQLPNPATICSWSMNYSIYSEIFTAEDLSSSLLLLILALLCTLWDKRLLLLKHPYVFQGDFEIVPIHVIYVMSNDYV